MSYTDLFQAFLSAGVIAAGLALIGVGVIIGWWIWG